MKINEIKSYQKKIDIVGNVVEKTPLRSVVSRLDNIEHKVCEAVIQDDTGKIYLTLWDDSIEKLEIGKTYIFSNLFSSEFKNELRVNLGRFGEFREFHSK